MVQLRRLWALDSFSTVKDGILMKVFLSHVINNFFVALNSLFEYCFNKEHIY